MNKNRKRKNLKTEIEKTNFVGNWNKIEIKETSKTDKK